MISCINGATTMPYTLEQDLEAAAKAGFEAVEIWSRKLDTYLEANSVDDLKVMLDRLELKVASLCPYSLVGFADNRGHIIAIRKASEIAEAIDCPVLLVCGDAPPEGVSEDEAYDSMANVACTYADWAEDHGVKIAIEPLGGHPFIPGPKEALEIIERADHDSLGLMLDTFHYYKSGVSMDAIRDIPLDRLFIVHVNDCEDLPAAELTDGHRLHMGEGILPLKEVLGIIKEKGYEGALSVEIFREAYWNQDPEDISRDAKAGLDRTLALL
ncbi:MAG: sugar phosphate isomerase/epimerase [Candidatus Latescibacteria bacterium]|jgi:2-keto-myo-inositol isomerase|nr:sugar phosphate isomerase/epimerase [Candidatus Latescibacterota bacterium]